MKKNKLSQFSKSYLCACATFALPNYGSIPAIELMKLGGYTMDAVLQLPEFDKVALQNQYDKMVNE